VAPLSGHYATLLRGTVEALLPHFEIYITDWADGREVPTQLGGFDLDDYIDYLIEFMEFLGPEIHTMAVCQPAVPLLAAVAIMADSTPAAAPASMTLIGGPVDTRKNPTEVNKLATKRSLEWFKSHVITRVPFNYPGFLRPVYPGFLQLSGFMTMNLDRHIGEHVKLFQHLVNGDGESAEAHKKFYNEYLSVLDLPAEFYLQTIEVVFQQHALPKGEWVSRGRHIDPSKITRTALLTLEGELDDISGVGQTQAAQTLCSGLKPTQKKHHLQPAVGHYGIFNGRKFRDLIVPIIKDFAAKQSEK
jgi:poly(3-hydroxybutyrate) depolymerase